MDYKHAMIKILFIVLFSLNAYPARPISCSRFFDSSEYHRVDALFALSINTSQIITIKRVNEDGAVHLEILHRNKSGFIITKTNASLDLIEHRNIELPRITLRRLLDLRMKERLMREGFVMTAGKDDKASFFKASDSHRGIINDIVIEVKDNMVYQIYSKARIQ